MALPLYQKITRVLPGKPFGDGSDGALTISASQDQSQARNGCSGTAGSTTLNLAGGPGGLTNGNVIFIHQTRGSGAGQWEINKIVSGGGTATLTLEKTLQFTYSDGGNNQAQVIKIPMHTDITINPGVTLSAPKWDQDTGGVVILAAKGTLTVNGTINTKGVDSPVGGSDNAAGLGYWGGGNKQQTGTQSAKTGEGTPGPFVTVQTGANNGNGGGGGHEHDPNHAGGGGGGNGTAGGSGQGGGGQAIVGAGGTTAGNAELTLMAFGGGGGGGAMTGGNVGGAGGCGGANAIIIAKNINITGSINSRGGNGSIGHSPDGAGGGGGGGGSVIAQCKTAALGGSLINATGGAGGTSGANAGGAGGIGRIAVHHSGAVTGTTNPAFTDILDGTLTDAAGGSFLLNFT